MGSASGVILFSDIIIITTQSIYNLYKIDDKQVKRQCFLPNNVNHDSFSLFVKAKLQASG